MGWEAVTKVLGRISARLQKLRLSPRAVSLLSATFFGCPLGTVEHFPLVRTNLELNHTKVLR